MGWCPLEQHTPLETPFSITSVLSSSPSRTGPKSLSCPLFSPLPGPALHFPIPQFSSFSLFLLCLLQAHSYLDQSPPIPLPPPTPASDSNSTISITRKSKQKSFLPGQERGKLQRHSCQPSSPHPHP